MGGCDSPILTSLLASLRSDELLRANVGDVRRTDDGAVIHVRGKGGKDRRIPVEQAPVDVLEAYLDSRAVRCPILQSGAPPPRADWPPGHLARHCSSVPRATELPVAPCNIESCAPCAAPASTPTAPEARWSTG
jgi:integrase